MWRGITLEHQRVVAGDHVARGVGERVGALVPFEHVAESPPRKFSEARRWWRGRTAQTGSQDEAAGLSGAA